VAVRQRVRPRRKAPVVNRPVMDRSKRARMGDRHRGVWRSNNMPKSNVIEPALFLIMKGLRSDDPEMREDAIEYATGVMMSDGPDSAPVRTFFGRQFGVNIGPIQG